MTVRIINADVMEGLRQLPDESVHCVCTSPPYWGLRDYGVEGQIGLEATPEQFVARMVEVFAEVKRVLRKDGTCWVNLGDSYASGGHGGGGSFMGMRGDEGSGAWSHRSDKKGWRSPPPGLKQKDLVGIPWRVAFAMQADGWYLRSDIIWHKPNPMPESVTDRPTKAHEYVFLLTKSERYAYDAEAILEAFTSEAKTPGGFRPEKAVGPQSRGGHSQWDRARTSEESQPNPNGRNKRTVWTIATAPYSEAHFATFPPELPEICIKAGCPVGGTVLDPFNGAGTTAMVADRLQRNAIGIELNPEYAAMAQRRIAGDRGGLLDIMEAAE